MDNIKLFGYHTLNKYWVKYNPVLGKIWTNPAIGLFSTKSWLNV